MFRNIVHDLAREGKTEAIKRHAAAGHSINKKKELNGIGYRPIHIAARCGRTDTVEALHDLGASIKTRNDLGNTPIYYAAMYGHTDTVAKLHNLGANIDVINQRGNTPLHVAFRYGQKETIIELHRLGANLSIKNNHGKTALDIAVEKGYLSIVNVLLSESRHIVQSDNKVSQESDLNSLAQDLLSSLIITREQDLECPVCLDIPKDAIYRCTDEHLICQACYDGIKVSSLKPKCVQCQVPYSDPPKRFRHMEKIRDETIHYKDLLDFKSTNVN